MLLDRRVKRAAPAQPRDVHKPEAQLSKAVQQSSSARRGAARLKETLNDYRADPSTDAIGRLAIMAYSAMSGRHAAVRRKLESGPRPLRFARPHAQQAVFRFSSSDQRALMSFNNVPAGKDLPQDFNVIIEIPAQSDPVKYEADKETGLLHVDRFIGTGMRYPANYGYIPQTLSGDGDPVDVLVLTPFPLLAGSVVRARALGMLQMTDESGVDAKLVAVAHDKVCPMTADLKSIDDVPAYLKDQIKHFFEQYKALEKGKWVKVEGWAGIEAAHKEISEGVANFKK
jgi:inorganic pyrophosphatase